MRREQLERRGRRPEARGLALLGHLGLRAGPPVVPGLHLLCGRGRAGGRQDGLPRGPRHGDARVHAGAVVRGAPEAVLRAEVQGPQRPALGLFRALVPAARWVEPPAAPQRRRSPRSVLRLCEGRRELQGLHRGQGGRLEVQRPGLRRDQVPRLTSTALRPAQRPHGRRGLLLVGPRRHPDHGRLQLWQAELLPGQEGRR
mmetsp:Transcript_60467/g.176768  ORF Transcript_60467/g.176768 Transcript_60467/m.176768 type:complete len:200 (-) Transcript_60467:6-605(-)